MTRPFPLLSVWLLVGCITKLPEVEAPCEAWDQTGLFKYSVEHDGKNRKAYVFVPEDSVGPRDMVVVLHGAGESARDISDITKHIELARKEGFVAVFPQGTHPLLQKYAWNAGKCCHKARDELNDVDDVGYLDELVSELEAKTCSTRVMATGFSNGGMMAHRWACESDSVDAVVAVSGPLFWDGTCKGRPIPMRHYHGVDDPVVKVDGWKEYDLLPLRQQLKPWLARNQCTSGTPVRYDELGKMTCEVLDCEAATEVCLIQEWKHVYPGGIHAGELDGIDATAQGWEFFLDSLGPNPGLSGDDTAKP